MSSETTLIEALAASLRQAAQSYHPGVEEAPVAVLWTDPESDWLPLIPQVRVMMPELLVLGDYAPDERQGPSIWLKTALGGKIKDLELPKGQSPILYLPGVARHQLRNADQCELSIQPLVELLYRGVAWTHKNGRDWSVEAFMMAEDGLGLDLAQDAKTLLSLHSALAVVGQTPVSRLQGRRLEASDFDSLVIGDTPRDLLTWIGHGEAVKAEWSEERWHAFRSRCQDEFNFDPGKEDPLFAAERLGLREGVAWRGLWDRLCEAPAMYGGVRDRLDLAQPTDRMSFDPEPWPRENVKAEEKLRQSLLGLKEQASHAARLQIRELYEEHGIRINWVWAKLGESPLATALSALNRLAETTGSMPSFSSLENLCEWYAESGWEADAVMLEALQFAVGDSEEAVHTAIRVIYQPWLEEVSRRFQELSKDGMPKSPPVKVGEGECLLFVDGLRFDVGRRLTQRLNERGYSPELTTRLAALPTVTATAKPAVAPISGEVSGETMPADFRPNRPDGKELSHARFLNLLDAAGVEKVDEANPGPNGASSRGWCETGRIDSRGHDLEAELAGQLPAELDRVLALIERLFSSGWRHVKIVTDHGWLLMPGGLEKYSLPGYLVESRWSRCASIKGQSVPDTPIVEWHWNGSEHVAVAPGACSFKAGVDYSHGGVSPQECVLPVITLSSNEDAASPALPKVAGVRWKRQRCTIEVANPIPGLRADLRQDGSDPDSSVCSDGKEVEGDGVVSLLVADPDLNGQTVTLVLISGSNQLIAKAETTVGG